MNMRFKNRLKVNLIMMTTKLDKEKNKLWSNCSVIADLRVIRILTTELNNDQIKNFKMKEVREAIRDQAIVHILNLNLNHLFKDQIFHN